MTTPQEDLKLFLDVRDFLEAVCQPRKTSGVPQQTRLRAYALLQRYPATSRLRAICDVPKAESEQQP